MDLSNIPFTISSLRALYLSGAITPHDVVNESLRRAVNPAHPNVWISVLPRERPLSLARNLNPSRITELPLYGIPFAIKDNIDLAGVPTTCGCPAFSAEPLRSATAVERLIAAGAIPIGKTNLDQFATELVGTRSPYGACSSVFDPSYISGGSSSGSAVTVASGMVSFALGTDTAGSGRVPAAFNHIVGLKPTKGLVSTRGVFPACRSLDCVSIFAGTSADAQSVLQAAAGADDADPYSRVHKPTALPETPRIGIPKAGQLEFFGDTEAATLFAQAREALGRLGATFIEIDLTPFLDAASLLYAGPWVAERRWAVGEFLLTHGDAMDPIVREIIAGGDRFTAVETFDATYRLQTLRAVIDRTWEGMDAILLPTTGTIYKIEQIKADPIRLNSNLGKYTNFVNLLDLAAIAIPAGFRGNGLPFGVSLMAPAFSDEALLWLGDRLHRSLAEVIGATGVSLGAEPVPTRAKRDEVRLAVVGAHLSNQPLNWQLTQRGGHLIAAAKTAQNYRLFALANTTPPKPGLVRTTEAAGDGIDVEIWGLSTEAFGSFTESVPMPMVIGTATLADGSSVKCFLCEPTALEGAEEITHLGGWRAFLAVSSAASRQ